MVIKDFLDRTVEIIQFNPGNRAILPNTTRIFRSSWGEDKPSNFFYLIYNQATNFAIGKFEAKAVVKNNEGEDIVSDIVSFWVFPWQLLLSILVVTIVALITEIVVKYKIPLIYNFGQHSMLILWIISILTFIIAIGNYKEFLESFKTKLQAKEYLNNIKD